MELREWLIILGLALVTLIVIDGVRRLQRQRQVPRLDRAGTEPAAGETTDSSEDPDEAARQAELRWELPNGGARVVRPAEQTTVQSKPKLQRQDHPGPSRVLSEFRRQRHDDDVESPIPSASAESVSQAPSMGAGANSFGTPRSEVSNAVDNTGSEQHADAGQRREPELDMDDGSMEAQATVPNEDEPRSVDPASERLAADPDDHEGYHDDDERYRMVDLEGMGDSLKSGSRRMGSSVHRLGSSLQKTMAGRRDQKRQNRARKEQERAERKQREQAEREEKARLEREEAEARAASEATNAQPGSAAAPGAPDDWQQNAYASAVADIDDMPLEDDVVRAHPVLEKAMRHDVAADHARKTLSHAEEVIVISVMSREEQGFSGTALLELMLACGLRYDRDMGIFHRFETEDAESPLQFSMVNVVKPGTFPIQSMDDFSTPGVTLLLPLPSTCDTTTAFEAMVETAMVVVRHLGGELKDEHMSVMTAQTVEFARQRVQEFERRHRLHRYQVN